MQRRQLARYPGLLTWRTFSILYFVIFALANRQVRCKRDGRLGHGAGGRVNLITFKFPGRSGTLPIPSSSTNR